MGPEVLALWSTYYKPLQLRLGAYLHISLILLVRRHLAACDCLANICYLRVWGLGRTCKALSHTCGCLHLLDEVFVRLYRLDALAGQQHSPQELEGAGLAKLRLRWQSPGRQWRCGALVPRLTPVPDSARRWRSSACAGSPGIISLRTSPL